jgi:HNH endonuclease
MVVSEQSVKTCRLYRRELPLYDFHRSRSGKFTSRCKRCHGVAIRRCHICSRPFIGKSGRKACSPLCSELLRAPTFLICKACGQLFGPVSHLKRRNCSKECADAAARTGKLTFRRTITKARSAQSLLRYHIQAGHIVRPTTCEECGATDRSIQGAHFDYDKPLHVRWLCVSCHRKWDKREPKHATYVVEAPITDDASRVEHGMEKTQTTRGCVTPLGYRRIKGKDGKKQLPHVYVWESHFGPVPEGKEIYHINGNKLDNRIENLQVLTRLEHSRFKRGWMREGERWLKQCSRCHLYRPIDNKYYVNPNSGKVSSVGRRCYIDKTAEQSRRRKARRQQAQHTAAANSAIGGNQA